MQYGDFSSNHTVYYDRQAQDTPIKPRHVLLHPLKAPQEWWHAHQTMIQHITAKEVQEAEREYFWDGRYTTTTSTPTATTTTRDLCQAKQR